MGGRATASQRTAREAQRLRAELADHAHPAHDPDHDELERINAQLTARCRRSP